MGKENHRLYRVFGIYPGMPMEICDIYKEAEKRSLGTEQKYDQPFMCQALEELACREIDWRRQKKQDEKDKNN